MRVTVPQQASSRGLQRADSLRARQQAPPAAAAAAAWLPRSSSPSLGPTKLASHNRALEAELQHSEFGWPELADTGVPVEANRGGGGDDGYSVIGLGQSMVDFAATTSDEFLAGLGVVKGARRLITVEERGAILASLDGASYQISAGGSLSNTLMALARLSTTGVQRSGARELRVAMAGLVGSDPLGAFYTSQMREAGVEVLSAPVAGTHTGTVCVLTTPDAQRTMLSYLGTPAEVEVDAALEAAISRSRMLVVEGYLWELPNAGSTILRAIEAAQRAGTAVAMTAGDAGVVERHHAEIWDAIGRGIDLLFTNAGEAAALLKYLPEHRAAATAAGGEESPHASSSGSCCSCGKGSWSAASSSGSTRGSAFGTASSSPAQQAALALGPFCSMVVVTDGSAGSYITALGQLHVVPPVWMPNPPVDTCGAGDSYAAGLLYSLLQNHTITSMGRTAARTAAAVISVHGAHLTPEAALALADQLPTSTPTSFFESLTAHF